MAHQSPAGTPVPNRYDGLKRGLDVVLAAALLVAFSPLMAVVGTLVYGVLGSPVLFFQERAGRLGRPFIICKFRSLTGDAGCADGRIQPDESRLTRLGRFLRTTGLDELPQLWNVLRGDMSLIGPRPLYMRYLKHYTPSEHRRHHVRPGITGLAQVNGRNGIGWRQQFALDVHYVENRSPLLDGLILWRTLSIPFSSARSMEFPQRPEHTATATPIPRSVGTTMVVGENS